MLFPVWVLLFYRVFQKSYLWHVMHIFHAENMAVFLLTVKYSFSIMIACFSFYNNSNLLCRFCTNIHTYIHKHVPTRASNVSRHRTGGTELPGHLLIWMNMRLLRLLWKKKQTQQFLWEFMQCEQNTSWQNGEPRNSSLVALLGKLHFKFLAEGFVWLAPGKLFNIFINPVVALEPTLI